MFFIINNHTMATLLNTVSSTAYPLAIAAIVILTAWALFTLVTKKSDSMPWTDVHTGVSIILSGAMLVQLSGVLHRNGR